MTGEVLERRYDGTAVRHDPESQRYHCLASTVLREPCKNLSRWFYLPSNSHLCLSHIRQRVAQRRARSREAATTPAKHNGTNP